jgi:ribosomal protein S18 acetylase RimI-like enzyme
VTGDGIDGRGADLEIRPIRPDEYDALGDLTVAAYREIGHLDEGYSAHIRDVATRAALVPVLVAVDPQGTVVGGVTYVPGPGTAWSERERDDEAGFRMLAVDPAVQGRGAGRRLVLACMERARQDGRRGMVLLTLPSMRVAHRLYEDLGFRRDPDRDWFEEDLVLYAFAIVFDPGA